MTTIKKIRLCITFLPPPASRQPPGSQSFSHLITIKLKRQKLTESRSEFALFCCTYVGSPVSPDGYITLKYLTIYKMKTCPKVKHFCHSRIKYFAKY